MNDSTLKKKTIVEVAFVRILVVICQLIFLKAYTHYTSLYELGIYYFIFTISYSLNAFLLVPLDYFQQSQLYRLKSENLSLKSFYSINQLVLKIAGVLLLVSCAICLFIKPEFCLSILMVIALAISTYGVTMLRGIINNLERRRQAIYTLLFETVCKILIFLLFVHLFNPSAYLIICAMLAASLLTLGVLFLLLINLPEYKLQQRIVFTKNEIFNFAYPISIGAVTNWIQLQSYTLILVPLGFVEAVGIFGTVANVGSSGMNACSTVFSQLYIPNIYKTNGKYIKTYLRNALLAIAFVLVVSTLLSKIIVGLLTKQEFVNYSLIILFGILTEAGNFIIGSLTIYLTIHNLTKTTVKMSAIGLFVFFLSFASLYIFKLINVYTLGIPMVLTQLIISIGLYTIVNKTEN
jgi:O-antigen/teichoic acid export membrane protein